MTEHINERNFYRIINSETPVIVDFWAPWCGPCKMLGPVMEDISREFRGVIKVAKLNIDENPEIAGQLRVTSIPTVLVFRNGRIIDRFVGFMPKSTIVGRLERGGIV